MVLTQHLDQVGRRTATEPVGVDPAIGQCVQQTERIVYIGRRPREMITVVILFQDFQGLFRSNAEVAGQTVDALTHLFSHLLFRDTADRSILGEHTDILDIIQLAEDTQLGEFRDAGQEDETQVGVACLQWAVEVAHHVAQHGQILLLMHHIQQRSVVLIDQDNHLLPGLLEGTFDKALQAVVHHKRILITPINGLPL